MKIEKPELVNFGSQSDMWISRRLRSSHLLLGLAALYLIFLSLKFHKFLEIASVLYGDKGFVGFDQSAAKHRLPGFGSQGSSHPMLADSTNEKMSLVPANEHFPETYETLMHPYGRIAQEIMKKNNSSRNHSSLERMADEAWILGLKAWKELDSYKNQDINQTRLIDEKPLSCPSSLSWISKDLNDNNVFMSFPCGLVPGSSITVVATPHFAHKEYVPQIVKLHNGNPEVWVSQFVIELQGLREDDSEDPPKILHLNPRLKGDWGQNPVIEHNTCYRMQWGQSQRCQGIESDYSLTVDGFKRCEKWLREDNTDLRESKRASWLRRFVGRAKKPEMTWPFPFVEGRLFALSLQAGIEGYHTSIGGRHVTSFPYRTGFTIEEAAGLAIKGNIDVHAIHATSLPVSYPAFTLHQSLEMSERWKSIRLPKTPVLLFIGIISAPNHFAERMAIRKTWFQYKDFKLSKVVARFFVALSPRKEVNVLLRKEADYFGDIVPLLFMDHYELVVLKTIAICKFSVHNLTADYIMKCDDDTFVRLDSILEEIGSVDPKRSHYMGNINLLHKPLRSGKWAVTYELEFGNQSTDI